jgi:hypothetical protein
MRPRPGSAAATIASLKRERAQLKKALREACDIGHRATWPGSDDRKRVVALEAVAGASRARRRA